MSDCMYSNTYDETSESDDRIRKKNIGFSYKSAKYKKSLNSGSFLCIT